MPNSEPKFPTEFKGIPYSQIIAEYWNRTGGEPNEGERNKRLHQLAVNLRAICDNNEEWLLEVIPQYGLSVQEMKCIIHSACKEPTKGSKLMDQIVNEISLPPRGESEGGLAPEMPKKLPKLINLLVSKTPDIYKAAVAHAVFPALATHLWRTRFRYIDNKLHEATLMNVLMAGTGAGKDCISEPIDHIMADIRRNDAENMRREKEWKDEVNAKGANKDKRKRPEGLVIQEIDADMTNPAFVMRMAEADEHFLYVKLNEIDQFDALKGNCSGGQQFRIMCLAFDPNNRYGQTRIGTQSVTERVCIRFNWNATTTIQKGQKYFARVLTDGPLSRINFCTIPEREIGAEIPVYGEYDSSFDEELKPYIERLCAARGEIDCPQAFKLAKKLNEECAEFSRLSQSRTYENFTFRANVIAYLKA
ncbi:MAG: VirE protein, partial [Bacteroidaceae bacterium]|nr:VirE protein [Bacteroidaceae bacterium]